jgi:hypothetical protein
MAVLKSGEQINIDSGVPLIPPEEFLDSPGRKDVVSTDSATSGIPDYLNPASQGTFDDASNQATGWLQDKLKADESANAQLNKRAEGLRRQQVYNLNAEGHIASQVPEPWDAKKERAETTTGPMEKFGSAAMVFAGIASAFSKTPAIASLNAGAAVLQAINDGDEKAYRDAHAAWKENTELAVKRFNMQREIYSDTNALFDKDISLWKAKLIENATRLGDQQALNLLQHGQYPQFFEAEAHRAKAMEAMLGAKEHFDTYELRRQAQQASFAEIDDALGTAGMEKKRFEELSQEERKRFNLSVKTKDLAQKMLLANPNDLGYAIAHGVVEFAKREQREPNEQELNHIRQEANAHLYSGNRYGATLMGAGYTPDQPLSPAREEVAKSIATYRQSPPSPYAMGRPENQELMARANVLSEEINGAPYDVKKYKGMEGASKTAAGADTRALSNSLNKQIEMQTALESFEKTAIKNLDKLVDLAKKVDKTGVPIIEKWIRAGRQSTGDPDVSDFNLQWTLTTPEIARIITSPRLVGQLTDTARNEVHNAIQSGASVKQLQHARDLLVGDFERRRQSTNEEIATIRKQLKEGIKEEAPAKEDFGGWH